MNKKAKNNTVNTKVLENDSSRDEIGVSKKKTCQLTRTGFEPTLKKN